jgi:PrtD family type I secretion system ABC transporter
MKKPASPLDQALRALRPGLALAAGFSLFSNLLLLAVPLYTMQVFDRVLASGRVETLVLLTLITGFALVALGLLEAARASILARLQTVLGVRLSAPLLDAAADGVASGGDALRDLGQLRTTIIGSGVTALFDAPWLPVFILAMWVLHPTLGGFALASGLTLLMLALAGELLGRAHTREAGEAQRAAQRVAEAVGRHHHVVRTMNLFPGLGARFSALNDRALDGQQRAAEGGGMLLGLVRFVRLLVQVGVMGLGAWLVIEREISPGAMIAASILLGRALAPVEQLIPSWRTLIQARDSCARLRTLLAAAEGRRRAPLPVPAPVGGLTVEGVHLHAQTPAGGILLLRNIDFALGRGELLGVAGPSGSGKSTLCRLLVGATPPSAGSVRLDGAEINVQLYAGLGRHIGYLPQEVCLFAGTIGENIARFCPRPDPADVVEAARLAGVHETILRLPQGYETELSNDDGAPLSGGQRQRIGLARALFGGPQLLVLDEPNAHLDGEGEAALLRAIAEMKRRGSTIVMVAHRASTLAQADRLLVLGAGAMLAFGPREEVVQRFHRSEKAA